MDPRIAATPLFRWSRTRSRRKIHLRRRKWQVVRLGGKNNAVSRGGFSLKKMVRKMKLRWLKLHYVRLVKKIKGFYLNLVKEFVDAGAELEAIQQRMAVEAAAFAVPGLGLSFSSFSVHDRARYFLV
ncbi:unnamed protein product [Arabidopsis lyrata]|uniref:Uncharacterized protein n=1 Tax=Arabidopsis lyrata subsp. lyrata TaxID=81972 RepID=D7KLE9_ARALL|nr:uncharacterized protein LOC9327853 [Arabidopsis lyrata subsp. lyrata]EFH68050.1 hypothetical protein ARALYDRAFT_474543 [Arabidopsis lyrata subsp. lyrata]CAH8255611.1 unnamed protein product [Arabidopsis lyrata]|eukprot:XP_002891791.1 uncharacterized protein LOC9327853 [Arabidopsis lyrata subsp. lyrata]